MGTYGAVDEALGAGLIVDADGHAAQGGDLVGQLIQARIILALALVSLGHGVRCGGEAGCRRGQVLGARCLRPPRSLMKREVLVRLCCSLGESYWAPGCGSRRVVLVGMGMRVVGFGWSFRCRYQDKGGCRQKTRGADDAGTSTHHP